MPLGVGGSVKQVILVILVDVVEILGVSGNCVDVNSLGLVLVDLFSVYAAGHFLTKNWLDGKSSCSGLIVYHEKSKVRFLNPMRPLKSVLIVSP